MSSKKDNVNRNSKLKQPEAKKQIKETTKIIKGKETINGKKESPMQKTNVKPSETKEVSINKTNEKSKEEAKITQEVTKESFNGELLSQKTNNKVGMSNTDNHIHDENEKGNVITNNDKNNQDNEENEYKEEIPEAEDHSNHIKKESREDLTIKPREDYLKAKIEEMNMSKDLLSGITKGINNSILSIKDGFITSQLQNIPVKQNKEIIALLDHNHKKLNKSDSVRLHCIKELKRNEASLMNNIYKINQNQKVLESESMLNLSITSAVNLIEDSLKKKKIEKLKHKKELLKNRLEEVKYKIESLVHKENIEEGDFNFFIKQNLHKFEVNFEKDKGIAKKKLTKLQKESIMRQQKMSNELGEKYELKVQRIEHREKESEQKKMVFIEQLRQQEKEVIVKRSKINREKYLKMKEFINNKFKSKSYTYLDLSKKYVDNENQLIERERIKRRELMKHISNDELIDFEHKISIEKSKIEEEIYEKTQKLKELWFERRKLKPEYINPFYIRLNEEKAINEALNEEKEDLKESNRQKKKEYSRTISQPKPNPRLMINNIDINGNSNIKKRKTLKRMRSFQEIKYKASTQIENLKVYKLKEINEINMKNYKMQKPTKLIRTIKQKQRVQSSKQTDYLLEKRKENIEKASKESIDWDQEINKQQSKLSLKESIMNVHDRTLLIDEKIKQKNQLLRLNGGVSQHPDICDEVSNLMINSIKAKLSIIDKAVLIKKQNYLSIDAIEQ